MKILLLSSSFFGYSKRVADHMRICKHDVDEIFAYPISYMMRILNKCHLRNYNKTLEEYYKGKFTEICDNKYDKVIVFGGGTPAFFIEDLKVRFPLSEFTLYLSADMSSYGFSKDYLSLFDRRLSYSLSDSGKYGFNYTPWFYTDIKKNHKDIDVSFVGTIHPIRLSYLENIKRLDAESYLYIYSDSLTYLKYIISWRNLRKDIHFTGLSYDAYIDVLSRSIATLDIPEKGQNNITTRPIEALATNTKIITTNKNIVNYDFYNDSNILIINDSFDVMKIRKWLELPYVPNSDIILKKYSIDNFIDCLLDTK